MSAAFAGLADPAVLIPTLLLGAILLAIAVWDARSYRIPDILSLPLMALGLFAAFRISMLPYWHHVAGLAAGFGVLWLVGRLYRRARAREGLGLGDAKLLAAGGAWLGWAALPSVLVIATLAGLAGHALARALGRPGGPDVRIAFGPYLAGAIFLVWIFGPFSAPPVWR